MHWVLWGGRGEGGGKVDFINYGSQDSLHNGPLSVRKMIAPPWLLASFSCNFLLLYLKQNKTWIDFHLDSCLWSSLFRLTLFRRKRCSSFHFYPFNVICAKYCVASSKESSETKPSLHFWAIVEYLQIFKDPAPVYTGVKSYLSKLSSPHKSMRANYCYIHFERNQIKSPECPCDYV